MSLVTMTPEQNIIWDTLDTIQLHWPGEDARLVRPTLERCMHVLEEQPQNPAHYAKCADDLGAWVGRCPFIGTVHNLLSEVWKYFNEKGKEREI